MVFSTPAPTICRLSRTVQQPRFLSPSSREIKSRTASTSGTLKSCVSSPTIASASVSEPTPVLSATPVRTCGEYALIVSMPGAPDAPLNCHCCVVSLASHATSCRPPATGAFRRRGAVRRDTGTHGEATSNKRRGRIILRGWASRRNEGWRKGTSEWKGKRSTQRLRAHSSCKFTTPSSP